MAYSGSVVSRSSADFRRRENHAQTEKMYKTEVIYLEQLRGWGAEVRMEEAHASSDTSPN